MSRWWGCATWTRRRARHVRDPGVHAFTMRDIDERGMRVGDGRSHPRGRATERPAFTVSLDMDFVDPQDAPGVGTPVRGGVTYREAHLAMEMICDSRPHGVDGSGGSESGDRRSEPHRRSWRWN